MGYYDFDKNGNNTRCYTRVYFTQNADSVTFSFDFWGYCLAKNSKFLGNSDAYVWVTVDGTDIVSSWTKYAGQKVAGHNASGSSWIEDYTGSKGPITLAAKDEPYTITVWHSGNFTNNFSEDVSFTFKLPIYVGAENDVKQVSKIYVGYGGEVKEVKNVYVGDGGEVKVVV